MDQSTTPAKTVFKPDMRWFLAAVGLLLIISLWSITFSQQNSIQQETIENAQKDANIAAAALSDFTLNTLQTCDQITLILQERFKHLGKQLDAQAYLQESGMILAPYTSIILVAPNGSVISSNIPTSGDEVRHFESVQYHLSQNPDRNRTTHIAQPFKNPFSGKWEIQFSRRILNQEGKVAAVVLVGIDIRNFNHYYDQTHLNPNDSMALVGEDGIVRTRKSGVDTTRGSDISKSRFFLTMTREQNGASTSVSEVDGRTRFYAFRKLDNYPLFIVVGIDSEDSLAAIKTRERRNLNWLIFATIAIVLTCAVVIRHITGLKQAAPAAVPAAAQIHPALQAAYTAPGANQHLQAVWQHAADAMLTTDIHYLIESANPAAETLFGNKPLTGQSLQKLVPWLTAPKTGISTNTFGYNVECIRHDGLRFPAELSINHFHIGKEKKFIVVLRDSSERKRVEQTKTNFVSAVSDELRAPLKAMRYAISTTLRQHADSLPESIQNMLQIANQNGESLTELINDLLDVHELEAHCMQFHFATWPLASMLNKAVAANLAYARDLGITLNLHTAIPECSLKVDQERFLQIMHNLLTNACKFSSRGSLVSIQAHMITSTRVRVAVIDRGIGIADEFRPRLFEKFSQAQEHTPGSKTGTGLGLTIAKSLAEHMGGEIGFHSVPGQGSTFFIELGSIPAPGATQL